MGEDVVAIFFDDVLCNFSDEQRLPPIEISYVAGGTLGRNKQAPGGPGGNNKTGQGKQVG